MQRIPQAWPDWQGNELIGRGTFGSVYKASRTDGKRTSAAAVKILDIPQDTTQVETLLSMGMDARSIRTYFDDTVKSVLKDILVTSQLKGSPGIVRIEEYQILRHEDGVGWAILIRMELLESLASRIERTCMPSEREAARIAVDLCRGLTRCHAAGIIHRNIKPTNIFRTNYGEYCLSDFGLVRRIEESSQSVASHAGASDYQAPEVARGHYDASVDTYSLGLMLYRWLNGGRPPFMDASEIPTYNALSLARLKRMGGQRLPLPTGSGINQALVDIVMRAVEPNPANRWASATEFGDALQDWLDGKDTRRATSRVASSKPTPPSPRVSGPMGIHINQAGAVSLCMGAATPTDLGSALKIGTVPVDAHGMVSAHDVEKFLAANGVDWAHACVATSLLDYPAVVSSRGGMARWVSTTNALAIDYALRDLSTKRFEGRFLTLHQKGSHVSLALYDWGDGVLEVLGTHAVTVEPYETLPDALARLVDRLMTTTGALLDHNAYRVLCLADDRDISHAIAEAYGSLGSSRPLKPNARLQVIQREQDSIARGAALQSMALTGRLSGFLLLDALPFDADLVFGSHRLPMIAGSSTMPILHTERICLRANDDLALELEAYDERGLRQRFQLPVGAERLQALAARKSALDVSVEVDAKMAVVVTLESEGWSQSFHLSELSPTTPVAKEARDERPAADNATPAGLNELIAALDDVDLGVRAMSAPDLESPAGAGMVALQGRLLQAIERLGAEHYAALGETFDPHHHEAMGTVDDPTLPANYIVDELRRGFRYQGRIIRYSLVRVANPL